MHPSLHPLYQTKRDQKAKRLGGEQVSILAVAKPRLEYETGADANAAVPGSSIRWNIWVCGRTSA